LAQGPALDQALLLKPPTDAWPSYHGDYSGRRYSTLTQINADNVKNLQLAWVYRLNTSRALANISGVHPGLPVLELSARSGVGVEAWIGLLDRRIAAKANPVVPSLR